MPVLDAIGTIELQLLLYRYVKKLSLLVKAVKQTWLSSLPLGQRRSPTASDAAFEAHFPLLVVALPVS